MTIWKEVEWNKVHGEALEHLKSLIRIKTVNPPGDEKPAAEYLADHLAKEGLDPEVIDSDDNRANMVVRLKGTGEKPPLLLNGHLDVVAVEEDKWSVPPFEAVEKDGFIMGRGAVDMKHMVTMSLMCMLLMKRAGVTLKRDLIFCAVADEEAGGQFGSRFMVENHEEKVTAEYALGEIGGFSMELEGKRFYMIQVAEKGMCWLKIKTHGDPGHGSLPDPDSAPLKAARIAAALGDKRLPQHNVEAVKLFVEKLSANLGFPKSLVFKLLLNPSLSGLLLDKVFPDKSLAQAFSAMLHNTANPTVLRAGEKTNVIPSEAEIEVDGRILPGQTTDSFLSELKSITGPDADFEIMRELTPTEAPADDPIFKLMEESIHDHDPDAIVLPNLVTGFTDAAHWKKTGAKCYGFAPVRLPADTVFKHLFHGHDERIPVEGFRFGTEVLFELVAKVIL